MQLVLLMPIWKEDAESKVTSYGRMSESCKESECSKVPITYLYYV